MGLKRSNKQQNNSLHPAAHVPFVPHFTTAAGEFKRCIDARSLAGAEGKRNSKM
jgi:hypothetical protein